MTKKKQDLERSTESLRAPQRLGRKLASIIAVKVLLIAAIFFMFFGPETRIAQNPDTVSQGILSPDTSHNIKGQ